MVISPFKCVVIFLLCLGTILFFNFYNHYAVTGPELLRDAQFKTGLNAWQHTDTGISVDPAGVGVIKLSASNANNYIQISQTIDEVNHYSLVRLSGEIRGDGVVPGNQPWDLARVVFVAYDKSGRPQYQYPHVLVNLQGTHDWEYKENVFSINPDTTRAEVQVQLLHAPGVFLVRNLSARPVAMRASFYKLRTLVTVIWLGALLWVIYPLARKSLLSRRHAMVAAMVVLIAIGTLMPEQMKEDIGAALSSHTSIVHQASTVAGDMAQFKLQPLLPGLDIYKAGHFFLFACLAAVALALPASLSATLRLTGILLLYALVTEVLQLLIQGRNSQLGDVIIDGAGIAAGYMLISVGFLVRQQIRKMAQLKTD
jgi:hypothetical protein